MTLSEIIERRHECKIFMDCSDEQLIRSIIACYDEKVGIIEETLYTVPIPVGNGYYQTLVMNSNGSIMLGDHKYISLQRLMNHNLNFPGGLTESRIKNSPLSWAWQFAKEIKK